MTLALLCIVVASILPIVCAGFSKVGAFRRGEGGFDNHHPREWLAKQTGFRARANAAQANSWEALIVFAPAVLAAHWLNAPQARIDALAVAFIVARVSYIALYLKNQASARSIVWALGFFISLGFYFLSFFPA
ncbi:MAG TPA: MAPEG family protein [Burkholderiaceae bacterium]|nr:MAPEG family protein [Burkholderiaceae bacterium]